MAVSVRDFVIKNPGADYDAITARFGTPQQITESCLEDMDTGELVQHLKIGRRIVVIVSVAALTVVLLWAGVTYIALMDEKVSTNGFLTEEIDIIERMPISVEGE